MKLKGQISILISADHTIIEVSDKDASIQFLQIELTPEQLSRALSRQAYVECGLSLNKLDCIGKKHESKSFEFEISEDMANSSYSNELREIATKQLSEGWIPDRHFASQNTFFTKDGKQYARCTIRRWV
jgi:uncharacterized protein YqgQ